MPYDTKYAGITCQNTMFIQTYSSIMRHTKNKKGPNATTASEPQKTTLKLYSYFTITFLPLLMYMPEVIFDLSTRTPPRV